MRAIFNRLFRRQNGKQLSPADPAFPSSSSPENVDVLNIGFPLVPDDYHLQHVGKTAQGNSYWITFQHTIEDGDTRDFVAVYIFDKEGLLISSEVVDQGKRSVPSQLATENVVKRLKRKIDAQATTEIWVKPFSVVFYGHTFGLVCREPDNGSGSIVVDAMPGWTLMFYDPWDQCNYAS